MDKVRIGVVGVGVIGDFHCRQILKDASPEFCLAAVCDRNKDKAAKAKAAYSVPSFRDAQKLFDSGLVDAVIIATPHYWHPPLVDPGRAGGAARDVREAPGLDGRAGQGRDRRVPQAQRDAGRRCSSTARGRSCSGSSSSSPAARSARSSASR